MSACPEIHNTDGLKQLFITLTFTKKITYAITIDLKTQGGGYLKDLENVLSGSEVFG